MVVWHNWQRWGYDYRLPDIYPANPAMGTHEELRRMADLCRETGVLFAPHDNYIDFYPDAQRFSYEKQIAFRADGTPVKAWINEWRGAQSYRYRADAVEPFLRRNVRLIRDGLRPNAFFIDVWSSIGPYDYWTADGQFVDHVTTRDSWGEHFAWIRDTLGALSPDDTAPQVSESGHDQLIGWLDGAQTNHLRVGKPVGEGRNAWCVWNVPCRDAERIPWFDAAHHDRFILHGAGYPSRYPAGLDARMHGIYSDDYMATEVLTGHPAMAAAAFGRDVVRKYWLLHDAMSALALRTIEAVEFVDGDIHRQHVRYSGGGHVWVNRGETDWHVAGETLPQYGFLVRVETDKGPVMAAITRRDGLIVETARSPGQVYVNGRELVEPGWPAKMSLDKIRLQPNRKLAMDVTWDIGRPMPADCRAFLHFVDSAGEIIFQGVTDSSWILRAKTGRFAAEAVAHVPAELAVGKSYELRMGFYRPADGRRLTLAGPSDDEQRIRTGTVRLDGDVQEMTDIRWTPHRAEPDPWLARQNREGKPIDFGPITTAGGCRLTPQDGGLLLVPLPGQDGSKVSVFLHLDKIPWKLPELTHVETIDEDGRVTARVPIRRKDDTVEIECEAGAFGYRLAPN